MECNKFEVIDGGSLFSSILSDMRGSAGRIADRHSAKVLKASGKNHIDIDGFIEVLYQLLDANNYITKMGEADQPNKFLFTEEYPDIEADSRNTITFEILKRAPASLSANADPFSGTTHYRPIYLGDEIDSREGGRVIHLQSMYDNMIRFRCWSSSTQHARKLATLMESIINKYYYIFRQYVPVIAYQGRSDSRISGAYGDARFHGIPLDLFVRTNERVMLREQDINCIEQNLHIGGST